MKNLGIPAAPVLKPPSEHFTLVSLQSGGVGGGAEEDLGFLKVD